MEHISAVKVCLWCYWKPIHFWILLTLNMPIYPNYLVSRYLAKWGASMNISTHLKGNALIKKKLIKYWFKLENQRRLRKKNQLNIVIKGILNIRSSMGEWFRGIIYRCYQRGRLLYNISVNSMELISNLDLIINLNYSLLIY